MSDLIDRQAAIEALEQLVIPEDMCVFEILSHIELVIGALPSAQPNLQPTCNQLATDTISRQAAIDDVCKMMCECFGADDEELDAIEVTLRELPAVQPEQKWIPCSERLPEENDCYLVQALMNDDIFVARWEGCYWGVKTPIIAWMPLPEPYKGGATE